MDRVTLTDVVPHVDVSLHLNPSLALHLTDDLQKLAPAVEVLDVPEREAEGEAGWRGMLTRSTLTSTSALSEVCTIATSSLI